MEEPNDTIFDEFLFKIDEAVDSGEPNMLKQLIKDYNNKISENYIKMAKEMYEQLVMEHFEDMVI